MIKRLEIWIIVLLGLIALWRSAYMQGRWDVYQSFAEDGTEGTCYSKGGCKHVH